MCNGGSITNDKTLFATNSVVGDVVRVDRFVDNLHYLLALANELVLRKIL